MLNLLLLIGLELLRVVFFCVGMFLIGFVCLIAYWVVFDPMHPPPPEARERLIARLNEDVDRRHR